MKNPFAWVAGKALAVVAKGIEWEQSVTFDTRDPEETAAGLHALLNLGTEKNFDWQHYQQITNQGMQASYANEFNISPTVGTLLKLYAQESLVNLGINAIMRQFLNSRLYIERLTSKDGATQKDYAHPLIQLFQDPGTESGATLLATTVGCTLPLAGDAFIWFGPDRKTALRLSTDRMQLRFTKDGELEGYTLRGGSGQDGFGVKEMQLSVNEVLHVKLPNPYSRHVGMSLLTAAAMPILIDKYGHEFVIGIFLRGGTTSGIMETDETDTTKLVRLAKSIMQAVGTRRNMHADKVLPKGVKFVGRSATLNDLQFEQTISKNFRRLMAHLKVPPFEVGDTDAVNRANADAQLQLFWISCIIPLQEIFCSEVKASPMWKLFGLGPNDRLRFDNSHVSFLDNTMQLLEQDAKLKEIATVNERRIKLGLPYIARLGNLLEKEIAVGAPIEIQHALTLNERRARQGLPPLDHFNVTQSELENELAIERQAQMATLTPATTPVEASLALPPAIEGTEGKTVTDDPTTPTEPESSSTNHVQEFKVEAEKLNDEPTKIQNFIVAELTACLEIVIDNPDDKEKALKKIQARAEDYGKRWAKAVMPSVMKAYDLQSKTLEKSKGLKRSCVKHGQLFVTKETEQDRKAKLAALRARAEDFLSGKVRDDGVKSFEGYTQTMTQWAYDEIESALAEGVSADEVASRLRLRFGEAYEGQALTIVRTEYLHGISQGQARFAADLGTVAKKIKRTWIHSGSGGQPRQSHVDADGKEVEESGDEALTKEFIPGLRYPRDERAPADETISCRCVMLTDVLDWGDEE